MANIKAFNALGEGFSITRGSILGSVDESGLEIVDQINLDNGKIAVLAQLDGIEQFDNMSLIFSGSFEDPTVESFAYFADETKVLDVNALNVTLSQMSAGAPAMLQNDDKIFGNGFNDRMSGFGGDDLMVGRGGNDKLLGGSGDDFIKGGRGHDTMLGQSGSDLLNGGAGRDKLLGAGGEDVLQGGNGRDVLKGGSGSDKLVGGNGNDRLNGGGGQDWIEGGRGSDILSGRGGQDVFVFNDNSGRDRIKDFSSNDVFLIESGADSLSDLTVTNTRDGLVVEFGSVEVLLENLDGRDISGSNFDFG